MQARMLDRVKDYTTKDWEKHYEKLRKDIKKFRQEVNEIQDKQTAIQAISKVDGFISLPLVMDVFKEIQLINYREVSQTFNRLTDKDIRKVINKDTLREFFKKMLGNDVRTIFEKLTEETRMVDLTEEKVKNVMIGAAQEIFKKGIVKYLKEDVAPEMAEGQLLPLLCTELFLICATELYNEADKRQTAGWVMIKVLMGPYLTKKYPAEALQNPFIAVRECAKLIQVNVDTGQLWREAALWLEGLYLRSFLQLPEKYRQNDQVIKAENGKMPLADPADKDKHDKDKQFQDNFGLTLYEMALFHHQTAIVIDSRFMPLQVVAPAAPEPVVAQAAVSSSDVVNQLDVSSVVVPLQPVLSVAPPQALVFQPIIAAEVVGITFEMLDNLIEEKPEVQFTLFITYLEHYRLSREQEAIFAHYTDVIVSSLDEYLNSSWTSHYVPTFFRSRPHIDLAKETKEQIQVTRKPQEQFKILFDVWKDLKGNASVDLKEKVADCIRAAVQLLYKDAKMQKETQARRERK